jgi:transcriptional regulator with XRE-family HTH domain
MTEIGKFMKESRELSGKTQKEVAEAFGWKTPQYVSEIERGMVLFPASKAKIYSQLVGVSVETLAEYYAKDNYIEFIKEALSGDVA